jgi:hypothetical protein
VSNALYFNRSLDDVIEAMNNPSYSLHPSIHNLYPVLEEKLGTWSSHVKTWLNSGLPLHLIRYEDMVSSPAETFSTALEFLDLHFPDELVLQAISETSFENLRKSEIQFGFKDKLQNCEAFFRNGKSGTWKESLSDQQVNRIVANHRDLMVEFGYLDGLETGNNKE